MTDAQDPNPAQEWEPIEARLQAADPAAGAADPDIAALRARVLAEPNVEATPNVVPLHRRRIGLTVGAIAAGVALLAGTALAGAAVGRTTAPQPETVTAAAPVAEDALPVIGAAPNSPPLPAMGGTQSGAMGPGAMSSGAMSSGAMSPESMSADAAKSSIYPGYSTALLPGPDLTDEAGTASGYRLASEGVDPEALARQLAAALGVAGEPRDQDGSWLVGPEDGSGPMIWVSNDAMVSWSYSDPSQNPWACAEPVPAESSDGSSDPGAPVAACEPTEKPMDEQDAVRAAKKLLAAVGVTGDPAAGIDIEWEAGSDDYTTWATAWQRVNDNRTQLSWSFTFGAKSPMWANGFAAGLEPVPAYPIVGALTAVVRSQDPRFSAFGPTPLDYGGVMPMAEARDTVTSGTGSSDAESTVPASDPSTVQVWWDPATAVGAELTLAQYWQPDGTLLLLPAYRITTADDRGTWAIIAVDESAVSFISP